MRSTKLNTSVFQSLHLKKNKAAIVVCNSFSAIWIAYDVVMYLYGKEKP